MEIWKFERVFYVICFLLRGEKKEEEEEEEGPGARIKQKTTLIGSGKTANETLES